MSHASFMHMWSENFLFCGFKTFRALFPVCRMTSLCSFQPQGHLCARVAGLSPRCAIELDISLYSSVPRFRVTLLCCSCAVVITVRDALLLNLLKPLLFFLSLGRTYLKSGLFPIALVHDLTFQWRVGTWTLHVFEIADFSPTSNDR